MKLRITTLLLVVFISINGFGQLDGYSNTDWTILSYSLNVVTLKNPTAKFEKDQKFGPFIAPGFALNHYTFNKGGFRYGMEFKWITDVFPELYDLFDKTYLGRGKTPFLSGLWWSHGGINVWSNEYFNIAVGGNFGDYFVEIPDIVDTGAVLPSGVTLTSTYQEPTGWYWAVGPNLYLDAVFKDVYFTLITQYSLSYWRPPIREKSYEDAIHKIDGYVSPHFLYFDFSANLDSGFFISYTKTMLIDRGVNSYNFSRNDIGIGWKL